MKLQSFRINLLLWLFLSLASLSLLLAGCASQAPAPSTETADSAARSASETGESHAMQPTRFDGPGHDYATAVQFSGANNPLAFSQKQQEWLWLHYRDWKKLGQALREKNGVRYDEVTLQNKQGEKRVIYFRMPK